MPIVLPFRNPSSHDRFLTEWEKWSEDATLLLFLSEMHCITWEHRDEEEPSSETWKCEREGTIVKIWDEENPSASEAWQVSTSKRVAVALRLDDKGAPVPDPDYPPIRVFLARRIS